MCIETTTTLLSATQFILFIIVHNPTNIEPTSYWKLTKEVNPKTLNPSTSSCVYPRLVVDLFLWWKVGNVTTFCMQQLWMKNIMFLKLLGNHFAPWICPDMERERERERERTQNNSQSFIHAKGRLNKQSQNYCCKDLT